MDAMEESSTGSVKKEPNEASDDNLSTMEQIINHRSYLKPTRSKTTMCSNQAAMESIAYQSQKRQAEKINEARVKDENYKQVLDVGDIGVVYVPPKTRSSCNHPYLPVMVTGTHIAGESHTIAYKICCQYGHLRGVFAREPIRFEA
jgi:hypothetical protein